MEETIPLILSKWLSTRVLSIAHLLQDGQWFQLFWTVNCGPGVHIWYTDCLQVAHNMPICADGREPTREWLCPVYIGMKQTLRHTSFTSDGPTSCSNYQDVFPRLWKRQHGLIVGLPAKKGGDLTRESSFSQGITYTVKFSKILLSPWHTHIDLYLFLKKYWTVESNYSNS